MWSWVRAPRWVFLAAPACVCVGLRGNGMTREAGSRAFMIGVAAAVSCAARRRQEICARPASLRAPGRQTARAGTQPSGQCPPGIERAILLDPAIADVVVCAVAAPTRRDNADGALPWSPACGATVPRQRAIRPCRWKVYCVWSLACGAAVLRGCAGCCWT